MCSTYLSGVTLLQPAIRCITATYYRIVRQHIMVIFSAMTPLCDTTGHF